MLQTPSQAFSMLLQWLVVVVVLREWGAVCFNNREERHNLL